MSYEFLKMQIRNDVIAAVGNINKPCVPLETILPFLHRQNSLSGSDSLLFQRTQVRFQHLHGRCNSTSKVFNALFWSLQAPAHTRYIRYKIYMQAIYIIYFIAPRIKMSSRVSTLVKRGL